MDTLDALGQVPGQDAEAGADLEHDVVLLELREAPDHAEDVLVDQEVLADPLLGVTSGGSPLFMRGARVIAASPRTA